MTGGMHLMSAWYANEGSWYDNASAHSHTHTHTHIHPFKHSHIHPHTYIHKLTHTHSLTHTRWCKLGTSSVGIFLSDTPLPCPWPCPCQPFARCKKLSSLPPTVTVASLFLPFDAFDALRSNIALLTLWNCAKWVPSSRIYFSSSSSSSSSSSYTLPSSSSSSPSSSSSSLYWNIKGWLNVSLTFLSMLSAYWIK